MRVLAAFLTILTSCAIPASVPSKWDVCIDILCPPETYCFPMFGQAECLPYRDSIQSCDLACEEGMVCLLDKCIAPNLDGAVCEFDDACASYEVCVLGYCTGVGCKPDESVPCYSGPAGTSGIGICRGGVHVCGANLLFSTECTGEVVPTEEVGLLACNGLDDDCDGEADPGTLTLVDLIFAFDLSGSMSREVQAVSEAISMTAAMYNDPNIHIGLIGFPLGSYDNARTSLIIPLSKYSDFHEAISIFSLMASVTHSSSGMEPSLDVPAAVINGEVDGLFLRPGAQKVIIIFTDEEAQSYMLPKNDELSMCTTVVTHKIDLYVLTIDRYAEGFDMCSTIYPLSDDPDEMTQNLSGIVSDICGQHE